MSKENYNALMNEVLSYKRLTDPLFVTTFRKHFDVEVWRTSPLIKQDFWLYNYLVYEYKGKLKRTGLLLKYIHSAFVYDDANFFMKAEKLNTKKPPLPKGVKYTKDKEAASAVNYQFSEIGIPKSNAN